MSDTPALDVKPRLVQPVERPSRWRLTYAWELQVFSTTGVPQGANRVVNLPVNPTRYEVEAQAAANIEFVGGGVSADEAGFVSRRVVVEGSCGLAPKRGWSVGSETEPGGMIYADGNHLWRELRKLFRLYGHIQRTRTDARARMVWHDFRNDDHWIVVPTMWAMRRNASEHRIHYPYYVEMTAVGDADDSSVPGAAKIFTAARDAVAQAVAWANIAAGYADDASSFLAEASGTGAAVIAAAQGSLNTFINAAAGIRRGVQEIMLLPRAAILAARDVVGNWEAHVAAELDIGIDWEPGQAEASAKLAEYETAVEAQRAMDGVIAQPQLFNADIEMLGRTTQALERGEGLLSDDEIAGGAGRPSLHRRVSPGSARRADGATVSEPRRRWTATRRYSVRAGDTVFRIASHEVGDPDAWREIARLNRLSWPYVSPDGIPGTAAIGDSILIPTNDLAEPVPRADGDANAEAIERAVLGVDVLLVDGDWVPDPVAGGGDIKLVGGADNYIQGLTIQFGTKLGDNAVFPWLGALTPVGEPQGAEIPEAVALSYRRIVAQDPRTREVLGLTVEDTGSGIMVEIQATPRTGGPGVAVRGRG